MEINKINRQRVDLTYLFCTIFPLLPLAQPKKKRITCRGEKKIKIREYITTEIRAITIYHGVEAEIIFLVSEVRTHSGSVRDPRFPQMPCQGPVSNGVSSPQLLRTVRGNYTLSTHVDPSVAFCCLTDLFAFWNIGLFSDRLLPLVAFFSQ